MAVVGTGNMGSNHVRVFDELPGADLVEIVEPDRDRARKITVEYDVRVCEDVDGLERAEAATIAVPNDLHRPIAETLLDQGLDLMVEKPLAPSVADAHAIVEAAEAEGAVLQVGHIERFNPAVETLREILADKDVIALEAHRLGPFNEQLSGESVVFDLMIHDLDIVDHLADGEVSHLDAVGRQSRSNEIDHAVATMKYENGVLATTVSSHVTHGKIRRLDITTRDAYIQLDYQKQSLTIQRRGVDQLRSFDEGSGYRTETITETPFVRTREPLKNELEHFLACVRSRTNPRVNGTAGVEVVRRADAVISRIDQENR